MNCFVLMFLGLTTISALTAAETSAGRNEATALANADWRPPPGSPDARIAAVINRMKSVDVDSLPAIEAKKFSIPDASIHVMRVKLQENYSIDGIGSDRVDLTGWIVVRQDAPVVEKPVSKEDLWNHASVKTEFVALELKGFSDLFGRVDVSLDPEIPATGLVGHFGIPEEASSQLLLAQLTPTHTVVVPPRGGNIATTAAERERLKALSDQIRDKLNSTASECRSAVSVRVRIQGMNLEMKTGRAVAWYSRVETIPPVGYTASVAPSPTPLISNGRKVGTLVSGRVTFRELVLSVPL